LENLVQVSVAAHLGTPAAVLLRLHDNRPMITDMDMAAVTDPRHLTAAVSGFEVGALAALPGLLRQFGVDPAQVLDSVDRAEPDHGDFEHKPSYAHASTVQQAIADLTGLFVLQDTEGLPAVDQPDARDTEFYRVCPTIPTSMARTHALLEQVKS
jgi:hypothetical protein